MPVKKAAAARLAELRALRASGKKRFDTYEVEEAQDIYDEVDEEGYKQVIRKRLDDDDFVVGDTGEGYADDGREDWGHEQPGYSSEDASDGDAPLRGNAGECYCPPNLQDPRKIDTTKARESVKRTSNRRRSSTPVLAATSTMAPSPRHREQRSAGFLTFSLLNTRLTNILGRGYCRRQCLHG